ncbi:response regulator [Virgibacillus sp. Bac332]|uniref:response regulator n=1 Tax=Virgibacillus sp. Bac332 TaxID=2419842 RepID=UPI00352BA009
MIRDSEVKVLLIEDDPMVQEVNKRMVERVEGFHVIAIAENGKQGLELCQYNNPDLVLLDIYMPEQDGIAALKALRELELDLEVIIISAANEMNMVRNMLHHGALDYRRQFNASEKVDQQTIDVLMMQNEQNSRQGHLLPKGLNKQTLNQVIEFLGSQNEPASADKAAESIGIARVTARRYLDYLEKMDRVEIILQYGVVGRPVNRYKLI